MRRRRRWIALIALSGLLALGACGGGIGGSGAAPDSGAGTPPDNDTPTASSGVMRRGSVMVNGVRFDASAAAITVNDSGNRAESELADGMVVKVKGRRDSDGVTGTAERIEAEHIVLGTVQELGLGSLPRHIQVLGQKILVDDTTVYVGMVDAAELVPDHSVVEVYGQRDAREDIRASRIELVRGVAVVPELQGVVADKDAQPGTFRIGGLRIGYTAQTRIVGGTRFANGDRVEVALDGTTALVIQLEDVEDVPYMPVAGDEVEIEGYVSGFTGHPGDFNVDGRPVRTTSATRFEGGSAINLADNVKVEAEGDTFVGGRLVVRELEIRRARVKLGGTITAVDGSALTLGVLGVTIQVDGRTEISASPGSGFSGLQVNDRVELDGYLDRGGVVLAKQINETDVSPYLQAPVSAKDETARRLLLVGVTADLGGTTTFRDANGASIDAATFFSAIVPASATGYGTVVKLRGSHVPPANLSVGTAELK
jgi:hypothetical protein